MKVLLGVGGSDDSFTALERTVERAARAGDDLTVAVVENPESEPEPDAVEARVREVLAATELEADVRRISGDPGSELVRVAESEGFDRLVLGGGEYSPMGKVRLGSIAEFVLLNSHVTVTLVR